jgi:molybdopterin converting factor small subunit
LCAFRQRALTALRLTEQIGDAIHVNQVLLHPTLTIWFAMARSNDITIHVPRELRGYCRGASEIMLSAPSVRAALDELEHRHPSLYRGICDDTGAVRRHVNVFVNKDHMRDRDGLDTTLVPGDEIIILPSVSGG